MKYIPNILIMLLLIGGAQAYDSHGKRNPFIPVSGTSGGRAVDVVDTAGLTDWFTNNLGGILWDTESPRALVGDKILSVGDEIRGCKIAEIRENGFAFEYQGKRVEIMLRHLKKEKTRDE